MLSASMPRAATSMQFVVLACVFVDPEVWLALGAAEGEPKRAEPVPGNSDYEERVRRFEREFAALAVEAEAVVWLDISETERRTRLRELDEQADELLGRRYNLRCESERRRLLELERRSLK